MKIRTGQTHPYDVGVLVCSLVFLLSARAMAGNWACLNEGPDISKAGSDCPLDSSDPDIGMTYAPGEHHTIRLVVHVTVSDSLLSDAAIADQVS